MCGITGIVYKQEEKYSLINELQKITDSLRHRGPDDEGFAFFNKASFQLAGGKDTPAPVFNSTFPYAPDLQINEVQEKYSIGLGHRRLSIIDVSPAGHQPFSVEEGLFWIVFNGEIYNYKELREELIKKGVKFITQSDTEVLLASYLVWGEHCLEHLNGMWSFVIYDKARNILFGARDRFGVKPFYYVNNNKKFAFASEQKALLLLDGFEKDVNEKAAFQYLVLGKTEMEEEGMFKLIFELSPGHSFIYNIDSKIFIPKKYYTLNFNTNWERFNEKKFQEYSTEILLLLKNAVNLRLRSDVNVGTCLSGGIDSSTLVCLIDEITSGKSYSQIGSSQKVFTACYANDKIDESIWAELVVKETNTQWNKIYADSTGLLNDWEDLAYFQDIPIPTTSSYSQYSVMKRVAAENVKVTLDGQAADELFSGYPSHFVSYFYEAFKNASTTEMKNCLTNPHAGFSNIDFLYSFSFKSLVTHMFYPYFKQRGFKSTRKEFNYINQGFWMDNHSSLKFLNNRIPSVLNHSLAQQFTGPDLKLLLRTGDRNSMRFSVESRMPFADDINLIEYVFNIPGVYKIRNGQSKSLLRNAMKGILPETVRLRKDKLGFSTPEYNWLNSLKDELRKYITPDLDQYFNCMDLLKDWDILFQTAPPHATQRLFRIINFAVWKKSIQDVNHI